MKSQSFLNRFIPSLLSGHRRECRDVLGQALNSGMEPRNIYHEMVWPAMEHVAHLFKEDQINSATEHMATRISRVIADQLQSHLPREDWNGKRIVIACADGEPEELGAQMCSDLFEADGWDVYFIGGGVPNDEILQLTGQLRPDILLIFGTQPAGVPNVRKLIDLLREIGSAPTMNVMISGGVFNRAAGLWKEVHADLFAETAADALKIAADAQPRKPEIKIPGAPKKRRRRRRRPPLLEKEAAATN